MSFEVIPAIDVAGGRLALFTPTGSSPTSAFGGDPLAAARAYASAGAGWVHVVDIDLALEGEARNLEVIGGVAAMGLRVQASGGVVRTDDVQAMLTAGAHRVVLGSAALAETPAAAAVIERFADRLVIGVEVAEGRIRSRGATQVDLPLLETLGWLVAAGAATFLVTAVTKVARLEGPDLAAVKRVVRTGRPVIAAGGVADIDDLRSLRRTGAAGAVVGRAALEGHLDLSEAIRLG